MLEDVNNKVAADISADDRKCKNEDSCPISSFQMTNSSIFLDMSVKCSMALLHALMIDSHQVYLDTFRNETFTSIETDAVSVYCSKLCLLDTEGMD